MAKFRHFFGLQNPKKFLATLRPNELKQIVYSLNWIFCPQNPECNSIFDIWGLTVDTKYNSFCISTSVKAFNVTNI